MEEPEKKDRNWRFRRLRGSRDFSSCFLSWSNLGQWSVWSLEMTRSSYFSSSFLFLSSRGCFRDDRTREGQWHRSRMNTWGVWFSSSACDSPKRMVRLGFCINTSKLFETMRKTSVVAYYYYGFVMRARDVKCMTRYQDYNDDEAGWGINNDTVSNLWNSNYHQRCNEAIPVIGSACDLDIFSAFDYYCGMDSLVRRYRKTGVCHLSSYCT